MKKSMLALLLASSFTFVAVGASFAAKVDCDCTVDTINGDKVTMTCGKAEGLKAGEKVKVETKKKGAVEGC